MAGLTNALDGAVDRAVLVQRPLPEPRVEVHAKPVERPSDLRHHPLRAKPRPFLERRVRAQPELLGQAAHVLALVALLGNLLPTRPRAKGVAEQVDLPASVVEVVLRLDVVAGEGEQPR